MNKKINKALGLICAGVLMLTGCGETAESGAVPVQAVSVLAGLSTGLQNKYPGKVTSLATQEVKREENRTVKELMVAAGDSVKAGQVLFTYDMDEAQLAIEQGELELKQLENSIETAKSQIKTLEKEKEKAKSSEQLEYTLQIQSLEVEIKKSEYNISAKNVELDRLRMALENTEVKSEIDGIVQSISENEYDNFGNPQAYITIMQVGSYRVEGRIDELNAGALPVGAPVLIRSRADGEAVWNGYLDYVDYDTPAQDNSAMYYGPENGNASSKYPFYVSLESSEGLIMGQHVFIELDGGQNGREGIWLPAGFVVQEDEAAYVWAATAEDKLEKRDVTVGETAPDTGEVQILSGLAAADYIAAAEEGLREGQAVTRYEADYFEGGEGDIPGGMPEPAEGDMMDVMPVPEMAEEDVIMEDVFEMPAADAGMAAPEAAVEE